jgi:prevent-host-death family protein
VKEIAISEFKAKCLSVIEEVRKTKKPVRITRRGKPVAELTPTATARKAKFVGAMVGTGEILGDILSPVIDLDDIEAVRD